MKRILAGILCFTFILSFMGCASSNKEKSQDEVNQVVTYEKDGVSFDVPTSWRYEEGGTGFYYFYPSDDTSHAFLMVQNNNTIPSIMDDSAYSAYIEGLETSSQNFTILKEEKLESENIKEYRYILFEAVINNVSVTCDTVLFDNQTGVSVFGMLKEVDSKNDYSDDFEKIIDSINLKYDTVDSSDKDLVEESTAENNSSTGSTVSDSSSPQSSSRPSNSQPSNSQSNVQQENTQSSTNNTTMGQRNALQKAHDYLRFMNFSRQGLIDQLLFEGYSQADAEYAVNNCGADWNAQALGKAKDYLDLKPFSYNGIIDQLKFEGYTTEQATYAANNCGADWNEQAVKSAQSYLQIMSFSREDLISQLEFEGFTHEQAVYGVTANGY